MAAVKELAHLENTDVIINPDEMILDAVSTEQIAKEKTIQRIVAQFQEPLRHTSPH